LKKLCLAGEGHVFTGHGDKASALYPGVCVTPSGRYIVTFRSARARENTEAQYMLMCFSDDHGTSWTAPRNFFPEVPKAEGKPGNFVQAYITPLSKTETLATILWVDSSDPARPYYNPETHGILDHRIFFSRSADNGDSWSAPWQMSGLPHTRPKALTSPTLLLPDGRLCCQFEVHKNHDEQGPVFFEAVVAFSADKGSSWDDYTVIFKGQEGGIYCWDQRINLIGDFLLGLYWTYDDANAKYLSAHAIRSTGGPGDLLGYKWDAPHDTGVPGQPSQPVLLGDGSVAMAFADRSAAPAIKVTRSFDGGKSWPIDSEVILFDSALAKQDNKKSGLNDMWTEMYRFSVGFPVAASTPDGGLVVCYYAGADTDHTSIKWAKLCLSDE